MENAVTMLGTMAHRAQSKTERAANIDLGQRLAALRKERGFTQVELAKQLGVIQGVISSYECGRVRPHPEIIVRIAEALGISTDDLLGRSKPKNGNGTQLDRRFVRRLQLVGDLPKRDQTALLRTLDAFLAARNALKAG